MWKLALNKFVDKYKDNKDVEAILLVGSYAAGNENEYSDIDVYVILNDNANYQERGNLLIDDYLIEYFINPIHKVRHYMQEDKRGHGGAMANMLLNGKVILDKNNIVPVLKQEALDIRNQPAEKDILKYYACWCAFDEYLAAKYNNQMQYYICLKNLIEAYLINNDYGMPPEQKLERFFKDEEYRNNYNIGAFPNNNFNILVINCFDNPNKENLKRLYDYVIEDGKFNINNFVYRREIK